VVYGTIAAAVAMATPIVRSAPAVDTLPLVLQWYIRPFADFTTFTAFPWMGFAFAGAGCGVLLAQLTDGRSERCLHAAFAAVGLVLVGVGFYTSYLPSIYRQSSFWSSSPTWFAIRAGIIMTTVSAIYAAERLLGARGWACRPLERLGRNSLFIYWIHIDLVYGYVSWGWRARLPLGGTVAAAVVFSGLMYGAAVAKERFSVGAGTGRPRRRAARTPPHVDGAMVT
jgi:uncharacterized membrane protein